VIDVSDELKLWLSLFKAETEEDLEKIQSLGVPVMERAIGAYRHITATDEFRELERQRHYAAINRATLLDNARREGEASEREKWQGIVADRDSVIAVKDSVIADRDSVIADKDAIIAELRERMRNAR
jgi:hypothetical protein